MSRDRFSTNVMRDRLSQDRRFDQAVCKRRDKAIAKDSAKPASCAAKQSIEGFLAAGGTITKVTPQPYRVNLGFNLRSVDRRVSRKARRAGGVRRRVVAEKS